MNWRAWFLPPSEQPNFNSRIGREGGVARQRSTNLRRSSASCVTRGLCSRRAEGRHTRTRQACRSRHSRPEPAHRAGLRDPPGPRAGDLHRGRAGLCRHLRISENPPRPFSAPMGAPSEVVDGCKRCSSLTALLSRRTRAAMPASPCLLCRVWPAARGARRCSRNAPRICCARSCRLPRRRSRRATALARPRWSTEMSTAAIASAHCSLIQHGRVPTPAHRWKARGRRALGLKALEPRPQPMIRKSLQRSAG